jgi:hypothetical protein
MDYIEMKHKVEKFLADNDFILLDYTPDGQDIYRHMNDDPKMDIKIQFIQHTDNL